MRRHAMQIAWTLIILLARSVSAGEASTPQKPQAYTNTDGSGFFTDPVWIRGSRKGNAAGWRNDGTGHYPEANPPVEWSQTVNNGVVTSKNIAWKVRLPAYGCSSPTAVGDRIFLTGGSADGNTPMDVYCINGTSGVMEWIRTFTYYDDIPADRREELARFRLEMEAVQDRYVFLTASRPLAAGSAAAGNFRIDGNTVTQSELIGTNRCVVKLTLAEPPKAGQPLSIAVSGVKTEDGQIPDSPLTGVAVPGRPVIDDLIGDFLIGEIRHVSSSRLANADLIGEASVKPSVEAGWKPQRSRNFMDMNRTLGPQRKHNIPSGGYAVVYLYAETPQTVQLRLCSTGALRVILGTNVICKLDVESRNMVLDQNVIPDIHLEQGWNRVIVGSGLWWYGREWFFGFRVLDREGTAAPRGVYYALADNPEGLTSIYSVLKPLPDFSATEAASRPLYGQLQEANRELLGMINAATPANRTALYPTQFPLNWRCAAGGWKDGNTGDGIQPEWYLKAPAPAIALLGRRKEIVAKLNNLMRQYDPVKYAHQIQNQFGRASATPSSDGTNVYVHFYNGISARLDLKGNPAWATVNPVVRTAYSAHGEHATPLLADGRYVMPLLAVDAGTGRFLWQQAMQTSGSCEEAGPNSPVLVRYGQESVIVISSGQGISLSNGRTVWNRIASNKLSYSTPVVQNGNIYIWQDDGIYAGRLPDALTPDAKLKTTMWIHPRDVARNAAGNTNLTDIAGSVGCYTIASPLVVGDLMYCVNARGVLIVADVKNKQILYQRLLDAGSDWPGFSASPAYAGGNIYLTCANGTTIVLSPGDKYEEVARNVIQSPYNDKGEHELFLANPVPYGKRLLLRGEQYLYCIGQ